ncbi:MAG: 1-acyl-sn-glycerol-3-phosphate acyltransferase [Firmicutes bacterium]|nr:1-acyl-sn-glycerol-3-phosphate acyltransferase [Bacillota bacterium]
MAFTILWAVTWYIVRSVLRTFAGFKVKGLENLDGLGRPVVIVSNHVSYLDPPVLGAAIPLRSSIMPVSFIARKEIYIPVVSQLITMLGTVQIDTKKPLSALRASLGLLKNGRSIAIFPEGTRSPNGELQSFMEGADFLAAKSGAPVLPVVIIGTFRPGFGYLSGLKKTILFLTGRYRIEVVFGEPFSGKVEEGYIKFYKEVVKRQHDLTTTQFTARSQG